MRVVSGSARGLKIVAPEGVDTRPTLDRVKEALFSMLTPYVRGAAALDLFAGSGALGIEALSRGAEKAVFVDNSFAALSAAKTNAERAKLSEKSRFELKSSLDYLSLCREEFSLIFIDPPYGGGLYEKALSLIAEKGVLKKDGIICVEWDDGVGEPNFPECFFRERDRRYGRVHITLLRRIP